MTSIARRGVCLVLAAPSGAGKTAIADALVAGEPDLRRSISVTTRPPRPDEVEGVHYRFCDQPAFDRMAAAGELLQVRKAVPSWAVCLIFSVTLLARSCGRVANLATWSLFSVGWPSSPKKASSVRLPRSSYRRVATCGTGKR